MSSLMGKHSAFYKTLCVPLQVQKLIDQSVQKIDPQVEVTSVKLQIVPVIKDHTDQSGDPECFIVEIKVDAGSQPVYYPSSDSNIAWIRRQESVFEMSSTLIQEREVVHARNNAVARTWRFYIQLKINAFQTH